MDSTDKITIHGDTVSVVKYMFKQLDSLYKLTRELRHNRKTPVTNKVIFSVKR